MSKNDFIKKIENGSDIMFDVAGKHYVILTWCDQGIEISEQGEDNPQYYKTAEELVNSFRIHDVMLSDLCDNLKITDYTSNS